MGELEGALDQPRRLVKQHRVYWCASEISEPFPGSKDRHGLRIELRGTHDRPKRVPIPGCSECQKVYRHLVRIAQAAIPDRAEWDARIEPFDEILTLKPERTPDLDVTLTVALLPKGVRRGSNQEKVRFLGEIEAKLEQLGAFKQS